MLMWWVEDERVLVGRDCEGLYLGEAALLRVRYSSVWSMGVILVGRDCGDGFLGGPLCYTYGTASGSLWRWTCWRAVGGRW